MAEGTGKTIPIADEPLEQARKLKKRNRLIAAATGQGLVDTYGLPTDEEVPKVPLKPKVKDQLAGLKRKKPTTAWGKAILAGFDEDAPWNKVKPED